jgi:hypothetical protein
VRAHGSDHSLKLHLSVSPHGDIQQVAALEILPAPRTNGQAASASELPHQAGKIFSDNYVSALWSAFGDPSYS